MSIGQPVRPVGKWADIMGQAQRIIVDRERGILLGDPTPVATGSEVGQLAGYRTRLDSSGRTQRAEMILGG